MPWTGTFLLVKKRRSRREDNLRVQVQQATFAHCIDRAHLDHNASHCSNSPPCCLDRVCLFVPMPRQQPRMRQEGSGSRARRSRRVNRSPRFQQHHTSTTTVQETSRPQPRPAGHESSDSYHDSVIQIFRDLDVRLDSLVVRTLLRDGLADFDRFSSVRAVVSSLTESRTDAALFYVRSEVMNLLVSV